MRENKKEFVTSNQLFAATTSGLIFVGGLVWLVSSYISSSPRRSSPSSSAMEVNSPSLSDEFLPPCYGLKNIYEKEFNLDEFEKPKLIYIKVPKVGSTTVSIVLEKIAQKMDWKMCCKPGCDVCAEHIAQECEFNCLGPYEPNKTVIFTNLRKPLERYFSRGYYRYHRSHHGDDVNMSDPKVTQTIKDMREDLTSQYFQVHGAHNMSFLKSLDVLGITEKMDEFMVDLALFLGWPLEWFTYRIMKLDTKKPDIYEIFEESYLESIMESLGKSNLWYEYAEGLNKKKRKERYSEDYYRKYYRCFEYLQSKVNKSCLFQNHNHEVESGKSKFGGTDCF